MTGDYGTLLDPLRAGAAWAPFAAAACGALTSVGPCFAPRTAALAALAGRSNRGASVGLATAFLAGICLCYGTCGYVVACAGRAFVTSPIAYDLTAIVLCAAGGYALLHDRCEASNNSPAPPAAGFALGAACAAAASPCCTTLVVPIALTAAASGQALRAALLVACFALGHATPTLVTIVWARRRSARPVVMRYGSALHTIAAAVTLATGLYYGVLA